MSFSMPGLINTMPFMNCKKPQNMIILFFCGSLKLPELAMVKIAEVDFL